MNIAQVVGADHLSGDRVQRVPVLARTDGGGVPAALPFGRHYTLQPESNTTSKIVHTAMENPMPSWDSTASDGTVQRTRRGWL